MLERWAALAITAAIGVGCATDLEKDPMAYEAVRDLNEAGAPAQGGPPPCIDTVFKTSCWGIGCHGSEFPASALDLESEGVASRTLNAPAAHGNISDGSEANCLPGELLIDGNDPEQSLILKKVEGRHSCGAQMPMLRTFPAASVSCLRAWVYDIAGKPLPP